MKNTTIDYSALDSYISNFGKTLADIVFNTAPPIPAFHLGVTPMFKGGLSTSYIFGNTFVIPVPSQLNYWLLQNEIDILIEQIQAHYGV